MLARKSLRWILPPLIIGILCMVLSILSSILLVVSIVFFIIALCLVWFFRDPSRVIGRGVVSPADGRILSIERLEDKDIGRSHRISIFMNLYDVHVNRSPIDGRVISLSHHFGSHKPAFNKDSELNERVVIILETSIGLVKIIQIAGFLARRIQPYIRVGDWVEKGERIGIIRFGSRVDVYLPSKVEVKTRVGIRVKAGVDTIGEIHD